MLKTLIVLKKSFNGNDHCNKSIFRSIYTNEVTRHNSLVIVIVVVQHIIFKQPMLSLFLTPVLSETEKIGETID